MTVRWLLSSCVSYLQLTWFCLENARRKEPTVCFNNMIVCWSFVVMYIRNRKRCGRRNGTGTLACALYPLCFAGKIFIAAKAPEQPAQAEEDSEEQQAGGSKAQGT